MTPDIETRKNPEWLNSGLKEKEELQIEPAAAENQDVTVESLRLRYHELCYEFLVGDLDPVARLLTAHEIKRLNEAIKTVERVAHAK